MRGTMAGVLVKKFRTGFGTIFCSVQAFGEPIIPPYRPLRLYVVKASSFGFKFCEAASCFGCDVPQ